MNNLFLNDQPCPTAYKNHLIVFLDSLGCWCIYDAHGDKVREPYWGTIGEARSAIDSGEAL